MSFEPTDEVQTRSCGCKLRKNLWRWSASEDPRETWVQEHLCIPHDAHQKATVEAIGRWERGEAPLPQDHEALENVRYIDIPF